MPKKNTAGVFQRLTRLRHRVRHIKVEIQRIASAVAEHNDNPAAADLKLQLRQARDLVAELDDALTPLANHVDVPFGVAPAGASLA